ncbi:MAG: TIGR03808 family TAT-translocated repetitive protein [Phyllobacteriaceae bacterium]|nr:TIGR03808 family TAT-translocated repetitive protein [Phyllobacteriaceae bacterium]MBA92845.1 TIGR03808 family TAT-translocated repetitive protein [Phyllobacteriaceae bacterium]
MMDRRRFFSALLPAAAAAAVPFQASARTLFENAAMRGSIPASELGVRPGALDDQSRVFQRMLDEAARRGQPVFLPPGEYPVSNLTLPARVSLSGVPGATRIVYTGNGHLFAGEDCAFLSLTGLTIDGQNRWLSDQTQGLIDLRRVARVVIDNCEIIGAGKSAVVIERCGGRIERSTLSGAQDYALYAVESAGLAVTGNTVEDCGNGGLLVHRWQAAHDGSSITNNRIARIGARNGGTGQFGNGINLFRAGGVTVANNNVSDCAFSAIRANSASNMIAQGNTCLRSGETALYTEFAFEGAVIAGNIVDGAANGISAVNFNEGGRLAVIQGNLVRNLLTQGPYPADPPGFGVGITAEADTSVSGNTVEGAPRYGLHLGWGEFLRNVVASGNVIRACGTGIAVTVADGAGRAVISGNMIADTPNGAIVGYRWSEPATGDLAARGAEAWPHLTVERNATG